MACNCWGSDVSGGVADGGDDAVDDLFQKGRVFTFGHDADQRFGA